MRTILKGLHIDTRSMTVSEMVNRLHWALIAAYRQGYNIALFIDEAQNMPVETLEALRMLSNLETHTDKLLQIVLVGQPELEEKLSLHALRQLRQRIAIRARIEPLTAKESIDYIEHRLAKAALLPGRVFSAGALRFIARKAQGCPRSLNIICDNALIAAYGSQQKPVPAKLARRVASELGITRPRRMKLWWAALGGVAACALLALGAATAFGSRQEANDAVRSARVVDPQEAVNAAPALETPAEWLVEPVSPAPAPTEATAPVPAQPETVTPVIEEASPAEVQESTATNDGLEAFLGALEEVNASAPPTPLREEEPIASAREETIQTWRVRPGETLGSIARQVYGSDSEETLEFIRQHNPQIRDRDLIVKGDDLRLPERLTGAKSLREGDVS